MITVKKWRVMRDSNLRPLPELLHGLYCVADLVD